MRNERAKQKNEKKNRMLASHRIAMYDSASLDKIEQTAERNYRDESTANSPCWSEKTL